MKKEKHSLRVAINLLFVFAAVAIIIGTVYYGSTPRQYDLQVGDISPYDISAPRDIADEAETVRRALAEMSQVPNIMLRSESRSEESRERVRSLIALVQEKGKPFTGNRSSKSTRRRTKKICPRKLRRRRKSREEGVLTAMRSSWLCPPLSLLPINQSAS